MQKAIIPDIQEIGRDLVIIEMGSRRYVAYRTKYAWKVYRSSPDPVTFLEDTKALAIERAISMERARPALPVALRKRFYGGANQ